MKKSSKDLGISRAFLTHELETEKALLANLIRSEMDIGRNMIIPVLEEKMFLGESNRKMFNAVKGLFLANKYIDKITVIRTAQKNNKDFDAQELIEIVAEAPELNIKAQEEYANIIIENYYRAAIVEYCSSIISAATDKKANIDQVIEQYIKGLEIINIELLDSGQDNFEDGLNQIIQEVSEKSERQVFWPSGEEEFDNIVSIESKNIFLFGGKQGSGKTRFIIFKVMLLLLTNKNIAINWINIEDPKKKIILMMLVFLTGIDYKVLKRDTLTDDQIRLLIKARELINSFDIQFADRGMSVAEITSNHIKFCAERKDKLCIVIIDNVMLLSDQREKGDQVKIDDDIALGIKALNDITNQRGGVGSAVFLVHHFTKSQSSKTNAQSGYRPTTGDLKGSSRYADISTVVLLLNKINDYKDILMSLEHLKYIVSRMFIIDIPKNRDGETGLIRYFADLGTINFQIINSEIDE